MLKKGGGTFTISEGKGGRRNRLSKLSAALSGMTRGGDSVAREGKNEENGKSKPKIGRKNEAPVQEEE